MELAERTARHEHKGSETQEKKGNKQKGRLIKKYEETQTLGKRSVVKIIGGVSKRAVALYLKKGSCFRIIQKRLQFAP